MIALALMLLAASATATPSKTENHRQSAECLVALQSGVSTGRFAHGRLTEEAVAFFERRIDAIDDAELAELLMISASESILTNRNRREIAFTCVQLYQVMALQERGKAA